MQLNRKFIKLPLVTIVFFSTILTAQQKNLYLIVGKDIQICQSSPYPIKLLRVNQKCLDTVVDFIPIGSDYDPEMNNDEDTTNVPNKIGVYHDLNLAVVLTHDPHYEICHFYIIHFDNELKIDTLTRVFPEESITMSTFYIVDINRTTYVIFKQIPNFYKKDDTEIFGGINLVTYKDTVFTTNVVTAYLHSEGEQGIAINESTDDASEVMKLKRKEKNGQVVYPISYPSLANKEFALFNVPQMEQFFKLDPRLKIVPKSTNGYFPLLMVNKQFIVYRKNHNDDYENGEQNYLVYDGEKQMWHETPYFKGISHVGVRQFCSWLAGHVTFEHQWGYQQKIKKYGEIPGKKYRPQTCKYGFTFDERANMFEQFPVGTLYLYNMKTYKYIEWDALENGEHQGDSEIILVQDDTVYYRINDKIYKAPIINGEKLGEPELLVTDPRVVDIHWAFIATE